jgi:hypothetical protein
VLALAVACGCNPTPAPADSGPDAGLDAGRDAGPIDAGLDAGDAGLPADAGDAGQPGDAGDAGDAGQPPDAGDAGDAGEPPDAGDGGFVEASHDAFPQIPYGGGPVLTHPALVTITFPNLAVTAQAQGFDDWIAASSWLVTVGAEYGVGDGPPPEDVELDAGPPPWTGPSDIAAFLEGCFDAGALPAPVADGGQLYLLYLASNTPLKGICSSVLGFHDRGDYQGVAFAYAVIPDCPESVTGFPDLENLELVASHEIVEAATNPYSKGWELTDKSNPWWAPGFGEVADVCEGQIWQDPDAGWYTQLIWSNQQAALGTGSPCVPLPTTPYFNVSPQPDSPITIDAGSSLAIPITGWSTAPVQPWNLIEMAYFGDFDPNALFEDAGIDNGVTQAVTLSVPAGTASGARTQVWLGSYPTGDDNYTSFWPVVVVAQ